MARSSSFERDSSRAPTWLHVVGVLLLVVIASVVVMCPHRARPGAGLPDAQPAGEARHPSVGE